MQKDVGRYEINIGRNTIRCFALGFQYYPVIEFDEPNKELFIVAKVLRFDMLFFFINIAKYEEVNWDERIQ